MIIELTCLSHYDPLSDTWNLNDKPPSIRLDSTYGAYPTSSNFFLFEE